MGRLRIALGHDLQCIGNTDGHEATIQDRHGGILYACPGDIFGQQGADETEHGAGEKLYGGKFDCIHRIHAGGQLADDQHMTGPEQGADQDEQITKGDGQLGSEGEQVHADDGQSCTDPCSQSGLLGQHQPEKRDENNVEPCDESGLACRGSLETELCQLRSGQPDLLQGGTAEQGQPEQSAADEQSLVVRSLKAGSPSLLHAICKGKQG